MSAQHPETRIIRPSSDLCSTCAGRQPETCNEQTHWCEKYSDAEIIEALPELDAGDKPLGNLDPPPRWDPNTRTRGFARQTGPHEAHVTRVICTCTCRELSCQAFESPAVFDLDPKRHFLLDTPLAADEAIRIVRLFDARRLIGLGRFSSSESEVYQYADQVGSIGTDGKNFVLYVEGDGCHLRLVVKLDRQAGSDVLRVVEKPSFQGCADS